MSVITWSTKQSYQSLTNNLLKLYKNSPQNHLKINSLEKKLSLLIKDYPDLNKIVKLADTLNQKNIFKHKKSKNGCLEIDLNKLNPEIEKYLPDKINNIKTSKMSINGVIVQDVKFTSIVEPLETEKVQISIRLRKKVIKRLKEQNPKYQVLINGILEAYIFNHSKG